MSEAPQDPASAATGTPQPTGAELARRPAAQPVPTRTVIRPTNERAPRGPHRLPAVRAKGAVVLTPIGAAAGAIAAGVLGAVAATLAGRGRRVGLPSVTAAPASPGPVVLHRVTTLVVLARSSRG